MLNDGLPGKDLVVCGAAGRVDMSDLRAAAITSNRDSDGLFVDLAIEPI